MADAPSSFALGRQSALAPRQEKMLAVVVSDVEVDRQYQFEQLRLIAVFHENLPLLADSIANCTATFTVVTRVVHIRPDLHPLDRLSLLTDTLLWEITL